MTPNERLEARIRILEINVEIDDLIIEGREFPPNEFCNNIEAEDLKKEKHYLQCKLAGISEE